MLTLTSCATPIGPNQSQLTYISVPPGAMLYENNTAWGMAPQTKIYTSLDGKTATKGVTAVWPSGAKSTQFFNVKLGTRQTATMSRPPNAPGMDRDLAFAEQLRLNQETKRAANDAALAAAIQKAFPPPAATPPPVICTSSNIGGRIQTICN